MMLNKYWKEDSDINTAYLYLSNISKEFSVDNLNKTGLY